MRPIRNLRLPTPALLVAGLCCQLLLPTAAVAQPPAGGAGLGVLSPRPVQARDGGDLFRQLRFLVRFLELSEEQVVDTRALLEQLQTDLRPLLREETRALAAELRTALDAEEPDALEVGGLVIAIDANREESAALRQAFVTDFEALLSAEQLERFERLWEALRERRERRHGEPPVVEPGPIPGL